ncbi:MAG: 16S rRNA (guanine(966)-N(2))-methyltransferase RsmD [Peptostreptococcales bacterium]
MRIIAGDFKGTKLITPKTDDIRPTGDKIKGAIFNMIAPYIYNAIIIDLFAGTGNLGLEALSRGANKVYFVEKSKISLDILKENIRKLGVENQSVVMNRTSSKALDDIKECADIIFLDPPYNQGFIKKSIDEILQKNVLADEGLIVAEHSKNEELKELPLELHLFKEKIYGDIAVSIYIKNQERI